MEPKTSNNAAAAALYATTTRPGPGIFTVWPFAVLPSILLIAVFICGIGWARDHRELQTVRADLATAQSLIGTGEEFSRYSSRELERIQSLRIQVVAPPASYMYFMDGNVPVSSADTVEFPVGAINIRELIPPANSGYDTIIVPIQLSMYRFGGTGDWYLWDDVDPLIRAIRRDAVIAAALRNSDGFVD